MYGHILRDYYYDGYHSMPFQRSAFTPPYRHQPYPLMQGMNGVQSMSLDPYVNSHAIPNLLPAPNYQPMPNYQPIPSLDPYYLQSITGFQPMPNYQDYSNAAPEQHVFQNPLRPIEHASAHKQQQIPGNGYPFMNPYPKASFLSKQPSGMKSVLNSFKGQDGSIDINKMVDTAGQMMNAVSQVSSVVKGFGGMFKG